ncbi:MAG: thioredoxin family protein [Anaerolineae bacterium]|nr:thioredoxin family protein [Anaerolineae bacterium]
MDRLLLLLVIAGGAVLVYCAVRCLHVRRTSRIAAVDPLLAALRPDTPAILYFTSPTCAPCKAQQQPALRALQADLGDGVQIVEVNALDDPAAATRWGVLSVPTTFVLDPHGQPREVNYGVAGADKLKRQVAKAAAQAV